MLINRKRVQVLLSTFDGAMYLNPLIESILAQDYPNLEILVRDDGSTDNTVGLLEEYTASRNNIKIICGENLGFIHSFFKLFELADSTADYFALCDQDDVWQPDKISRAIRFLEELPSDNPAVYCSRLQVVDDNLKYLSYSPIPPKELSFNNALVECPMQGCTMVLNRAAYQLIDEFPQQVYSHDWWIYLVISAFGKIVYDHESRILYRKHSSNTFGISLDIFSDLKVKIGRFFSKGKYQPVINQAREFRRIYGSLLNDECQQSLESLIESCSPLWRRFKYLIFGKVYRQKNFDNLVLKFLLLLNRL